MPPSRFSRRNDINSRGYCLKLFSPGCSCGSQTHPVPLVCSCSAGVKLEEQIPAGWGWQNKDRSRWDPPRAAGTFLVESRELRRASEHPCSTRMGSGGSLSIWGSGQSPGGQCRVLGVSAECRGQRSSRSQRLFWKTPREGRLCSGSHGSHSLCTSIRPFPQAEAAPRARITRL